MARWHDRLGEFVRGRHRGRWVAWLIAVVAAGLLPLSPLQIAPPARAEIVTNQTVCSLESGCPEQFPTYPLLGRWVENPDDPEARTLKYFSDLAVDMVLRHHQLPESDADAVVGWARNDAYAYLWLLLAEAIKLEVEERTPRQQLFVEWFERKVRAFYHAGAIEAAREYARWAGLSAQTFRNLIYKNSSRDEWATYLSQTPEPYAVDNSWGGASQAGYCNYRPPSPYESSYDASNFVTCVTACPSVFGCIPPTPTKDQFLAWGDARALGSVSDPKVTQQMANIAAGIGTAVIFAGTAVGVTVGIALASVAFALVEALPSVIAMLGTGIAVELLEAGVITVIPEIAGVTTAAGIGAALAALVFAVVTATLQGITVFDAANLPGSLADVIESTRTTLIDLEDKLDTNDGAAVLFAVFAGATLPVPASDGLCDNTKYPSWYYTVYTQGDNLLSDSVLGYSDSLRQLVDRTACLNPPAIPEPTPRDPTFRVKQQGSDTESTTSTIVLDVGDEENPATEEVRVSGNWFVATHTSSGGSGPDTFQTLRLGYRDWSGKPTYAWLLREDDGEYSFYGMQGQGENNVLTSQDCIADETCFLTDHIEYLGPDGQQLSARLVPFREPQGTPRVTTQFPTEGKLVTIDPNGMTFPGAVPPLRYRYEYQLTGCGITGCVDVVVNPPTVERRPRFGPIGAVNTHTWQAAGKLSARVTVLDADNTSASKVIEVDVAALPAEVDAQSSCAPEFTGTLCTVGGTNSVTGTITSAGGDDNQIVTVAWGDGTVDHTTIGKGINLPPNDNLTLTLDAGSSGRVHTYQARHVYTKPGLYYGSIAVANQAGGTVEQRFASLVRGRSVVTFPAITGTHVYGDVVSMEATGSGPGTVHYETVTPEVCEATGAFGHQIKLVGGGECRVDAYQEEALPAWQGSTTVSRTFTVQKAPLTVTAEDKRAAYGEAYPAYTATFDGLKPGDTPAGLTGLTFAGPPAGLPPGDYDIVPSGITSNKYAVTYVPGRLTIDSTESVTLRVDDRTRVYGSATPEYSVTAEGLPAGVSIEEAFPGLALHGAPAGSHVGTYPITVTGLQPSYYDVGEVIEGTETITPAPLTVTADDVSSRYGAASPEFTAKVDGLVNGDTKASLVGLTVTGASAGSHVGSYPITASGVDNDDYDVTYVDGTHTITPAPLTVTADDVSSRYGAASPEFTATVDGLVNGDTSASLTGMTVTGAPAGSHVGSYPTTASGVDNDDYDVTYVDGTHTITPAPLTVTADDVSSRYGAALPDFTATADGLVNGDTLASLVGLTVTGAAAGSHVGTYATKASGVENDDYDVTYVDGTHTVTPAPLTVTADDVSSRYGAALPEFTAKVDGLVNGDTRGSLVGLTVTGAAAGSDAGTYPTRASGISNGDYAVTYVNGTHTVTPAPLTIAADDKTVAYGTVATYTWKGSGWVNGDSDATLGKAGRTLPSCAARVGGIPASTTTAPGSYAAAITCSAAVDPNYTITYTAGRLVVDPFVRLAQTGLPSSVPRVATLDGATVALPASLRVGYGTSHSYSFPPIVKASDGTVYTTTQASFSGAVTGNVNVTATYSTVQGMVDEALKSGAIAKNVAKSLTDSWSKMQKDLAAGRTAAVKAQLAGFVVMVESNTPKKIPADLSARLLLAAQLVWTSIGQEGPIR